MSPRTFTLSLVAVAVTIICLWAGCAHAQGRYQARYDRAFAVRDYTGAATVLREAIADPTTSTADVPRYRAALARALLSGGRFDEAHREAYECIELAPCAEVLRELDARRLLTPSPPAPPAPPVERVPAQAPTPRRLSPPVVRVILTPHGRSWAPRTGPVVLWSIGAASLVTAAVLATQRADALAACNVEGDRARCPNATALDRAREAPGLTMGANVALGVGLAAVVAGTGWWLADGATVASSVTADGATVSIAGRW